MIVPINIFIISTLEIALANILRDVLVLLDVADVHQCSKVDFPYLLFLCAFFVSSFRSFSIVAFSSGINIGMEDLLFVRLGFQRHASLRDRSPESSGPYGTLDSSKFAEHNDIRGSHFFLHRFTLDNILYSRIERFTWWILSHRYAVPRDETTSACLHLQRKFGEELSWDLFIGNELSSKVVIMCRIRPFPAMSISLNCFCLGCFGFSPILSPHRKFPLGGVSLNNVNLVRWRMMNLLSARNLNFSVQYDDDKWNSFRATAWAKKTSLIPLSSFVSASWNSFLSPWDSPPRSSLLTVDSSLRVGSWNSSSW